MFPGAALVVVCCGGTSGVDAQPHCHIPLLITASQELIRPSPSLLIGLSTVLPWGLCVCVCTCVCINASAFVSPLQAICPTLALSW